jgi:hypothetical protein
MKTFITFLAVLCCTCVQAQDLRRGDKFFNGANIFSVDEVRMGTIAYLTSDDEQEMTLQKVGSKAGEYTYQPSAQAEDPMHFDVKFGDPVKVKQIDGETYLIFYNKKGEALHVYRKTTGSLWTCQEEQKLLVSQPHERVLTTRVLNRPYLQYITREDLRIMRNEILARHGYRFQSADLQQYFGSKSWYHPGNNNAAIKLSPLEQLNVELIKAEEAMPGGLHPADVAGDIDQSDVE